MKKTPYILFLWILPAVFGFLPHPQLANRKFLYSRCLSPITNNLLSIALNYSLPFGGCSYRFAHVSTKGYVSLSDDDKDASSNPKIAPFEADLIATTRNTVCYSVHHAGDAYMNEISKLLDRTNANFDVVTQFALVVTFIDLSSRDYRQRTSFQVALLTDGQRTAVLFQYPESHSWNTRDVAVTIGYTYGTALDPDGEHANITSLPQDDLPSYLSMSHFSNVGDVLGLNLYEIRDLRPSLNGRSVNCTMIPAAAETSQTSPAFQGPLSICFNQNASEIEQSNNCSCRSPYALSSRHCLGVNPEFIMFPYKDKTKQTCLPNLAEHVTLPIETVVKLGGSNYTNLRISAGGFLVLSNGSLESPISWDKVDFLDGGKAIIAAYGGTLQFRPNISSVCYFALTLDDKTSGSRTARRIMDRATKLIRDFTDDDDFQATSVIVVTYEKMAPLLDNSSDLSEPMQAATAQVAVISGSDDLFRTYVNLNYEFVDYGTFQPFKDAFSNLQEPNYPDWPQAFFDFPTKSGGRVRHAVLNPTLTARQVRAGNGSVVNANAFDQLVGNTGLLGSWLFRVDGPIIIDPIVRRAANPAAQKTEQLALKVSTVAVPPVSPLALCKNGGDESQALTAANCTCRPPYVGNGSVCRGANKDVIMFPYENIGECSRSGASRLNVDGLSNIRFFGKQYSNFYISSRGFVLLSSADFDPNDPDSAIIAPYRGDLEFSYRSKICYSSHSNGDDRDSETDASQQVTNRAGELVRNFTDDHTFVAQRVIVVTFVRMTNADGVHWQPASGPRKVVTAQAVITSSSSRTYVNFNYEHLDYVSYQPLTPTDADTDNYSNYRNWSAAGFEYRVLPATNRSPDAKVTKWITLPLVRAGNASVVNPEAFDQLVGNTGLLGSWLFRVDGTTVADPVVRRTKHAAPQTVGDLDLELDGLASSQLNNSTSPLATCAGNTNNATGALRHCLCHCRKPYVGDGNFCLGANPSIVMFPYDMDHRTCLWRSETLESAVRKGQLLKFGGETYENFQVTAFGYVVLTNSAEETAKVQRWTKPRNQATVAPFGGDLDFFEESNVCYTLDRSGDGYQPLLERATELVRNFTSDQRFTAKSVLIVTFEKMSRSGYQFWHYLSKPAEAVTAQAVIINGGDSDSRTYVNFNYEFTDYVQYQPINDQVETDDFKTGWQQAFEFPSTSNSVRHVLLSQSSTVPLVRGGNSTIVNPNAFDQLIGNTGLLGSWLYRVDGPTIVDPVVRRASNAAPQSFEELSINVSLSVERDSPLKICESDPNTAQIGRKCKCRSPYVAKDSSCLGANPDLILFRYMGTQTCLPPNAGYLSASVRLNRMKLRETLYTHLQVGAKGYVTFSTVALAATEKMASWKEIQQENVTLIAPFGGDLDFYPNLSSVCYSVHTYGLGYKPIIDRAEQLVRNYTDDSHFAARTVVVVTYDKMAPKGSSRSVAPAIEAVTAQVVLISGGLGLDSRTYVSFNYQFLDYSHYQPFVDIVSHSLDWSQYEDWEQAVFMFPEEPDLPSVHYAPLSKWLTVPLVRAGNSSVVNANAFDQLVGNTGLLGSWLFRVDGLSVKDPVVRRAINAAPQSVEDVSLMDVPLGSRGVHKPLNAASLDAEHGDSCVVREAIYGRMAINNTVPNASRVSLATIQEQFHHLYKDAVKKTNSKIALLSTSVNQIWYSNVHLDLEILLSFAMPCSPSPSPKLSKDIQTLRSAALVEATLLYILSKSAYHVDKLKTHFQAQCWPPLKATISSECASPSVPWWESELHGAYHSSGLLHVKVTITSMKSFNGQSVIEHEISGRCEDHLLPQLPRVVINCSSLQVKDELHEFGRQLKSTSGASRLHGQLLLLTIYFLILKFTVVATV